MSVSGSFRRSGPDSLHHPLGSPWHSFAVVSTMNTSSTLASRSARLSNACAVNSQRPARASSRIRRRARVGPITGHWRIHALSASLQWSTALGRSLCLGAGQRYFPQHFLCLRPMPQRQRSFLPIRAVPNECGECRGPADSIASVRSMVLARRDVLKASLATMQVSPKKGCTLGVAIVCLLTST